MTGLHVSFAPHHDLVLNYSNEKSQKNYILEMIDCDGPLELFNSFHF